MFKRKPKVSRLITVEGYNLGGLHNKRINYVIDPLTNQSCFVGADSLLGEDLPEDLNLPYEKRVARAGLDSPKGSWFIVLNGLEEAIKFFQGFKLVPKETMGFKKAS